MKASSVPSPCRAQNWFQCKHVGLRSHHTTQPGFSCCQSLLTANSSVIQEKKMKRGGRARRGKKEKRRAHDNRFGCGQRFKLFNMFNYSQADDPGSWFNQLFVSAQHVLYPKRYSPRVLLLNFLFLFGPLAPLRHVRGCQSWQASTEE